MNSNSLKDKIYQELFSRILKKEFLPDSFLVEKQLCEIFNVSRSPVREALIELCSDGILKNIPRSGYRVLPVSEKQMREAFRMRLLLEEEGFHRAFPKLNGEKITNLRNITVKSVATLRDEADISLMRRLDLNETFHLKLAGYSGDELLTKFLGETLKLLYRGMAQFMLDESIYPEQANSKHFSIIDAIEEGDKDKALEVLKEDICSMEKKLMEVIF